MADADAFFRSYLFVDVHDSPGTEAVAQLLEAAAAALRSHGLVHVHHIAFDVDDHSHSPVSSLTIYYDRLERRRHPRSAEGAARRPSLEQRTLRSNE